jgi:hypothetical protein
MKIQKLLSGTLLLIFAFLLVVGAIGLYFCAKAPATTSTTYEVDIPWVSFQGGYFYKCNVGSDYYLAFSSDPQKDCPTLLIAPWESPNLLPYTVEQITYRENIILVDWVKDDNSILFIVTLAVGIIGVVTISGILIYIIIVRKRKNK